MSLSHISVDGSLANPYVLAAFVVWSSLILLVAASVGVAARRFRARLAVRATLLMIITIASPVAVRLVGTLFYVAVAQASFKVGFLGSPPFWPFLAVAAGGVILGCLVQRPAVVAA